MRRNNDSFFHQLTCLSKLVQEVKVAQPNIMKLDFQKKSNLSPLPKNVKLAKYFLGNRFIA